MIKNEDIESIINHAEHVQSTNNIVHNELLDIYEGNLIEYVEQSMQQEFSANAFEAAKVRIAPINILKRTTDKLAKVYSQGVERSSATDNDLVTEYEEVLDLDNEMSNADSMLNLLRSIAFEPYVKDGVPKLRVLTPNQFTVWSNDSHDKTNPTAFIKFMGSMVKSETIEETNVDRRVNIYVLYDHEEFVKVNGDGEILERKRHEIGRIPFTYMNLSISKLIPSPDKDSFAMSVLIPKLLSDLNYASKYLSHGIRYSIDLDVSNLEGNPDAFWQMSSTDKENANPSVGVIAPSVDIDKVLTLTKEQLVMYLESRSLKVGSTGKFENSASGLAKIIDSADVTDVRKENMKRFKAGEQDLWSLLATMHNAWIESEMIESIDLKSTFSVDFKISLKYGDMTPIVDPQEKRDNLEFKLTNKLTTYERAVRESNPDLTKDEQDTLLEELAIERQSTETTKVDNGSGDEVQDPDSEGTEV